MLKNTHTNTLTHIHMRLNTHTCMYKHGYDRFKIRITVLQTHKQTKTHAQFLLEQLTF